MRRTRLPILAIGLLLAAHAPAMAQGQPTPEQMLTGLNMTVALVEYCQLDVPYERAMQMAAAGHMLELNLGLTRAEADERYVLLKEIIVSDPPDCATDIDEVRELLGIAE